MSLKFKTYEIDHNTTEKEVNKFLFKYNPQMFFILDIGPNKKRLWAAIREDGMIDKDDLPPNRLPH